MTNQELYYFAGKCLLLEINKNNYAFVKKCIEDELIDWTRFVKLCSHHLITPSIFIRFRDSGLIAELPVELQEYLQEIFELNLLRNKRILAEIKEITTLLNSAGIEPVFMKGSANLLDNLYISPGERIMGDIDFLVKEEEYLIAARLFEKCGYKQPNSFDFDTDDLKHYPRLNHEDKIASIEIHRLPVIKKYNKWFNQSLIRQEIKRVHNIPGCYVLSDKHKFIINFIHSQFSDHGHASGNISLRNLNDVLLISRRIGIKDSFSQIKNKRKAESYIRLIEKVTDVKLLDGEISFFSKWYLFRHNLSYKFKSYSLLFVVIPAIMNRLSGILMQIIQSVYSVKSRRYLIQRLANTEWRKSFLPSWKEMLH